jgi:ATP-dependent Clp protease ATP-binding subunit ClpA
MDHATLTDNNGRKADFRHVILVMTTNAGARDIQSKAPGFSMGGGNSSTKLRSKEAIERTFSPEFRNRIDGWIVFDPLPFDAILKVVDKYVAELQAQLLDKGVKLSLTTAAKRWFGERGFDPQFGARPMARLIQNELKKPLAELILFGDLAAHGGEVDADIVDDKLVLTPRAASAAN